jgi:hypothetical protein
VARDSFVLEHTYNSVVPNVPTYCGARSKDYMYVRFSNGYELFYDEAVGEQPAMLLDPAAVPAELKELAQTCQPPDGYTWGP